MSGNIAQALEEMTIIDTRKACQSCQEHKATYYDIEIQGYFCGGCLLDYLLDDD